MRFRRSQSRLVGLGLLLLGLALGGAFLVPEMFYPGSPFPRGPNLSEVMGLVAAASILLALHRWLTRRDIRSGRISFHDHPKPVDGWAQWAYRIDPFGKVLDD